MSQHEPTQFQIGDTVHNIVPFQDPDSGKFQHPIKEPSIISFEKFSDPAILNELVPILEELVEEVIEQKLHRSEAHQTARNFIVQVFNGNYVAWNAKNNDWGIYIGDGWDIHHIVSQQEFDELGVPLNLEYMFIEYKVGMASCKHYPTKLIPMNRYHHERLNEGKLPLDQEYLMVITSIFLHQYVMANWSKVEEIYQGLPERCTSLITRMRGNPQTFNLLKRAYKILPPKMQHEMWWLTEQIREM